MSMPPPYQNQPPHGYPPPQGGPRQPPQRSAIRGLITAVIVLAIFGGGAWYVWKYNTDPNGGKAKKEAARVAQVEENKKHDPQIGDCVKVQDPKGKPLPVIVDCGSPEAEYKTGERLYGPAKECSSNFDYGIQYSSRRGADYTLCFTKV
ncbi:LppU/SCO3897 family protein [Streptomyces triculaminicus]|uniref:LppU/SCO3897 family protein n=1 Tax=Streptomyces triculaminicus TaxID=2816232 RepID=UPI0037CE894A